MRQQDAQESFYGDDVDYDRGSPHLVHPSLRNHLVGRVRDAVLALHKAEYPLNVLEVGAGHGGYTEPALALGCKVTAVEMSRPSLRHLSTKFATNSNLQCVLDSDGTLSEIQSEYSMVLAAAVLHHIPDYNAFLLRVCNRIVPGGCLLTFQDPLWYPRVSRIARGSGRAAYLLWRLGQGELSKGLKTLVRRLSRRLDEDNPSDMVEYHVVRNGVDEEEILHLLTPMFRTVHIFRYWSSQSRLAQILGERIGFENTFGVYAEGFQGKDSV